jgi:hypothetical protein
MENAGSRKPLKGMRDPGMEIEVMQFEFSPGGPPFGRPPERGFRS